MRTLTPHHTLFIFFFVFSLPILVSAQSDQTALQFEELVQQCDDLLGIKLDDAMNTAREAMDLANSSGDPALKEQAQLLMVESWFASSNYDSTAYYISKIAAHYNELSPSPDVNYWRGILNLKKRNYSLSAEHLYKALDVYGQLENIQGKAKTLQAISEVFNYQGDFEKSIEYGDLAIELFRVNEMIVPQALAHGEMSYNYLFLNNEIEALRQLDSALILLAQAGSPPLHLARVYNTKGNIHKISGEYESAQEEYQNALVLNETQLSQRGEMVANASLGHVFLLQEKHQQALHHTLRALQMMNEMGDKVNLLETLMHASDIYAELGDYKKATEYAWALSNESDRLYEEKLALKELELTEKYEAGKRGATITLQAQQIDQQKTIQRLGIGITLSLALLLGTLFYFFQRNKKTSQILGRKNAENELLLKEIHHRVKNNLEMVSSLLKLQSVKTKDTAAREAMEASQQRVASIGMIHQRLYQVENLAAIEMREYFQNLGEGILDTFGASEQVEIDIDMDLMELDVDTAVPIGLIVNELLTNSLKYAFKADQKGKIHLQMADDDDHKISLTVSDNGIGMSKNKTSQGTGFGTQLIQLLTQQLQGSVDMKSENGTQWSFQFEQAAYA